MSYIRHQILIHLTYLLYLHQILFMQMASFYQNLILYSIMILLNVLQYSYILLMFFIYSLSHSLMYLPSSLFYYSILINLLSLIIFLLYSIYYLQINNSYFIILISFFFILILISGLFFLSYYYYTIIHYPHLYFISQTSSQSLKIVNKISIFFDHYNLARYQESYYCKHSLFLKYLQPQVANHNFFVVMIIVQQFFVNQYTQVYRYYQSTIQYRCNYILTQFVIIIVLYFFYDIRHLHNYYCNIQAQNQVKSRNMIFYYRKNSYQTLRLPGLLNFSQISFILSSYFIDSLYLQNYQQTSLALLFILYKILQSFQNMNNKNSNNINQRPPTNASRRSKNQLTEQPENLQQYIQVLYQHQKECQKKGKYIEADAAKKKVKQLKQSLQKRLKQQIKQRHSRQREQIERAHLDEFNNFNGQWQQKMGEFNQSIKSIQDQILNRHSQQYNKYEEQINQTIPLKPKQSAEVINLKKIQQNLAKQQNYLEAHKVQVRIQELQKVDNSKYTLERNKKINNFLNQLRSKQEGQLKALRQKIELGIQQKKKYRAIQLEKLLQKYQNVKKQLEYQQNQQLARFQKNSKKVLFSTISSSKMSITK